MYYYFIIGNKLIRTWQNLYSDYNRIINRSDEAVRLSN
jgi:hypothetical protein